MACNGTALPFFFVIASGIPLPKWQKTSFFMRHRSVLEPVSHSVTWVKELGTSSAQLMNERYKNGKMHY
jgi:hypothetical protein